MKLKDAFLKSLGEIDEIGAGSVAAKQSPTMNDVNAVLTHGVNTEDINSRMDSMLSQPVDAFIGSLKMATDKLINKASLSTSVADASDYTAFHGDNGLFTDCDVENDIISTVVVPKGTVSVVPAVGVTRRNTVVGMLTGFEEDAEAVEPNSPCEPAPSGFYQVCTIDFDWGMLQRCTKSFRFDELGRRLNDNDTDDLQLIGTLLSNTNGRLSVRGLSTRDMLNVAVRSQMVGVGIMIERKISRIFWQGNPANNVGTGYLEPTGLDLQITTGRVDTKGRTCPAIDSIVVDWAYGDIADEIALDYAGNAPATATFNLYQVLSEIAYYMDTFAEDTGTDEVSHALVMPRMLFRQLSALLATQSIVEGVANMLPAAVGRVTINDTSYRDEIRDLRTNKVLYIGDRYIPVITDSGLYEGSNTADAVNHPNPGEKSGGIYFLPMTVNNGALPATMIEYMDYRSTPFVQELVALGAGRDSLTFWSDDGVMSWAVENVKWCFHVCGMMEWRPVLRFPQYAAKVVNILYHPYLMPRSPYPDDEAYVEGNV